MAHGGHHRHRHQHHTESHRSGRSGWLRAAVLGSNDAIVSTSSLMIGVGAAEASRQAVLLAGLAGLVAGAMSMAIGEFVSVSSTRDAEQADIAKETRELAEEPEDELRELQGIYVKRGLDKQLALQVAQELTKHDKLEAHLRDELGIDPKRLARPLEAAVTSALSFAIFALLPIFALLVAPATLRLETIAAVTLVALASLGALGGYLAGAPISRATLRVTIGGALAMVVTAGIGRLLGVAVN